MTKKAAKAGKAKAGRKRSTVKSLSAKTASSMKGGLPLTTKASAIRGGFSAKANRDA